ncbi:MAG: hypothetical protein AB1938_21160 [Myxococcota bacterium]
MNTRPLVVVSCLALLPACVSYTRSYTLPITGAEGVLVVPAIVSTAEGMGLEAFSSGTGATVSLEDGTKLYWYSGTRGNFILSISLAHEGPDLDAQLRDVKVRADQIWQLAVQARQANFVGGTVTVPSPEATGPGYVPPPPTAAAAPVPSSSHPRTGHPNGFACASSLDCQSGSCQSGRCAGSAAPSVGGSGQQCSFNSDCPSRNCRFGKCVGGGPGAECSFSSDCPSGNCRFGKCE